MTRAFSLSTLLVFSALATPTFGSVEFDGNLSLRGTSTDGPMSWLDSGFGRFSSGPRGDFIGTAHFTLDWQATQYFGAYAHGTARSEPTDGTGIGVVEAYLHSTSDLGSGRLRLRLGHFILPTSRENIDLAWSSPYTLTFSALNSWIGEELRLSGLLGEYQLPTGSSDLRLSLAVFGGNDSSGALLAWRGWTMGDRLTVFGEELPLPPLDSLSPGGAFEHQLDGGSATLPFGEDLDGRAGWASAIRWTAENRGIVQLTRFDSRGDKAFHNETEYAWHTRFDLLGASLELGPRFTLLGEFARGSSAMGNPRAAHVDLDFQAGYLMTSFATDYFRLSVRRDDFEIADRDLSPAELNDEDGSAWTFAAFWEPRRAIRLGIELVDQDSVRPAALESGFDFDTSGRSIQLELRYFFGN